MRITIRTIGNSKGVVLPKRLLAQAGLDDQSIADLSFENGAIVLRKAAKAVRVGWAEAAQGNEALLLDEFGNAGDSVLVW